MKQLLVIIGMPGSGKDTQIEYLSKRRKLTVIRIGDLVRSKAKIDPQIEADLEAGNLVKNDIVNELVADAIKLARDSEYLISDGFPRDLEQAKWLEEFVARHDCKIDKVLLLDIDDQTALNRLRKRGRDDDDEATILHRLEVFHAKTDPVLDYYRAKKRLSVVDGSLAPRKVADEIQKSLGW